jgi:hypothetical protein
MNIFNREKSPKIKRLFDDEHVREMENQVKIDVEGLREGRKEDFLFLYRKV